MNHGNPCCLPSSILDSFIPERIMINLSLPSAETVFVRFVNDTDRRVIVYWLNFYGKRVRYSHDFTRGQFLDVNTFINHSWIFEDSETGDQLVGNNKKVFRAKPGLSRLDKRYNVFIRIPVYTLRQRALQVVRDGLQMPENIVQLGLPNTVLVDLLKLITKQKIVKKVVY